MDALRILAVEDNPADFRLLTEYLREDPSAHFEVVRAGTLKDALATLLTGEFAAVLLDLNLPDAHGLEVLEKIVAAKRSPAVIVLTGADNPEIGLRALSKKAQDYLVKGKIDGDSLIRSIRYSIERNKAEEAARQLNTELAKRAADIEKANEALQSSRVAALNLMEDALEARNKAEQISAELAKVSERLAFAQQSAGAGTWDWDMISGKLDWTPELFQLFGLEPATATFEVWRNVIFPEDRELASSRIELALQNHTRLVNEYRILLPKGEVRWINALGDTTYNDEGKPVRMSGICLDITDRKKVDLALAESEKQFRGMFELAAVGMAQTDPATGKLLRVNEKLCSITGYTQQELVGMSFETITHPDDRKHDGELFQRAARGETPDYRSQTRYVRKDGEVIWVNVNATFVRDASGKPLRLTAAIEDITVRKRAEEALKKALSEAEEGRRTLQALMDHVPEGITIADAPNATIRMVSRYGQDLLGGSHDHQTAADVADQWKVYHEDGKTLMKPDELPLVRAIQNGEVLNNVEVVQVNSKGGRLSLLCDAGPIRDDSGNIVGAVVAWRDITDRKRAEARLAESEHRYRNLFTNMSEGFALHEIVCDDDGRPVDYVFLEVNPSFEKLTGLKREQVVGKRVLDVLPQTEQLWIDKYGEVALTGEPRHFESFSAPLQRWFSVYAYCPDKRLFAVVFTDVTEVMKAQEREREALAMTTAARTAIDALEAMGEGVMVMDMDSIIRSVNPALEQMSGYEEREVQGRTLVDIIGTVVAKEDQQAALESMRFALQRKPTAQRPLTLVSRNGRRIPAILATSFIEATHGKPTAFVVTVRDISELRTTYQALEESERKYRELVESANSIILRITPAHDILFFNEYAEAFFGFDESEVLGRNVLGTIVPLVDSNGRDMKALLKAISEDTSAYVSNENENMCKNGRRVWVHWTNRAIRDARGVVCEILCVGVDVTRRKQLELERERYQQRLRELAERLASTEERERHRVSAQIHDTVIQTLSLSNIKLGALRKALADAQLADRADEVNNARAMIEEAIKESRSLMAELTPPLLYELGVTPALQDLTQRLEKKHGIPIRVHDDGQPKPIDKPLQSSLFEVTRELIVNALKHAGQCTITINLARENDHLRVCVKDNGVGFDVPADGRFVFHKSGGFGLFSIRERLDQIGGKLDVESEPGKGTTATILLPLSTGGK
jgi:PAS domain S-box-containing protein